MDVELGGATTGIAIENRLKIARHYAKTKSKTAKIGYAKKFYGFKGEELDKLIEHDFPDRAIFEANLHPKGIIHQTLLYGREEGRKRILAQKRADIRAGAYIKWEEKEVAETVARELALREKLRRKRGWRYAS